MSEKVKERYIKPTETGDTERTIRQGTFKTFLKKNGLQRGPSLSHQFTPRTNFTGEPEQALHQHHKAKGDEQYERIELSKKKINPNTHDRIAFGYPQQEPHDSREGDKTFNEYGYYAPTAMSNWMEKYHLIKNGNVSR